MDNSKIHKVKFQHPLNMKINFFFNTLDSLSAYTQLKPRLMSQAIKNINWFYFFVNKLNKYQ